MDLQTLTKIKAIVSRANAAHMFFMMSVSEDRYLDVVYPEWFVANGLLDPSFSPSKRPAPDVHFQQLHKAMSLLNSLARTESAQIIDRLTFDQARMELNSALQEMIGLTGALADSTPPPSMHYFGSVFLVCYLPLVSISIAQMKAESEIEDEKLDIEERYFSFALGGLAVALINFAFFGMFPLVGTVYHPLGCDAEDVPIFSLADSTQKACTAILGYATADMPTESPEEDDEVYATTDGFTRSPGGGLHPWLHHQPRGGNAHSSRSRRARTADRRRRPAEQRGYKNKTIPNKTKDAYFSVYVHTYLTWSCWYACSAPMRWLLVEIGQGHRVGHPGM
jgi:hypothetical protein